MTGLLENTRSKISFAIAAMWTVIFAIVLFGTAISMQKIVALVGSLVHFFQPDAGQATAFAFGIVASCLFNKKIVPGYRAASVAIVIVASLLTWGQADPLAPVAHVEQIMGLMLAYGSIGILGLIAGITLVFLPFILLPLSQQTPVSAKSLGMAFLAYLFAQFAVTQIGHFPVPILGAGAAPVIGWFLMIVLERVPTGEGYRWE